MTSEVLVKAIHDKRVRVTFLGSDGVEFDKRIVKAGTEQGYYVYDGQNLLIEEVQPKYTKRMIINVLKESK